MSEEIQEAQETQAPAPQVIVGGDDPWPVRVFRVEGIRVHPRVDRLTLVKLAGHSQEYVADRPEEGGFRYTAGDLVELYPEGCIMTRALMEKLEFWDYGKGKGTLGGGQKNRLTGRNFEPLTEDGEKFRSPGALRKCVFATRDGEPLWWVEYQARSLDVVEGTVIQDFLEIQRYVPQP